MSDKKELQIHIRVSSEESKMIKQKAKDAKMTISRFIVSSCKLKRIVVCNNFPDIVTALSHYTNQLNKIGTNINQISTIANSQKYINKEQLKDLEDYCTKLQIKTNMVDKFLNEFLSYICEVDKDVTLTSPSLTNMKLDNIVDLLLELKENNRNGM